MGIRRKQLLIDDTAPCNITGVAWLDLWQKLAAHSGQGAVTRDEQIACLGSPVGEMRDDTSTALGRMLECSLGPNKCIRDRRPQRLVDAGPNSGGPGPLHPAEYHPTAVELQEPGGRHADCRIHFGAGAAHDFEQLARKPESCAPPGKVS